VSRYYVNSATSESQFEFPSAAVAASAAVTGGDGLLSNGVGNPGDPAPQGWTIAYSRSDGAPYYVNSATSETQFEYPGAPPEVSGPLRPFWRPF
jgi:hypothetical protein